jgi:hypothetical protein
MSTRTNPMDTNLSDSSREIEDEPSEESPDGEGSRALDSEKWTLMLC